MHDPKRQDDCIGVLPVGEIQAILLNLGVEGASFGFLKEGKPAIQQSDQVVIRRVVDPSSSLKDLGEIEMTVKWVLDGMKMEHASFGGIFNKISKEDKARLKKFLSE